MQDQTTTLLTEGEP